MNNEIKRTWAEISLDNLEHNMKAIRDHVPAGTKYLGVVKAFAYGHGAVPAAQRLEAAGADYLAVACADEALELRRGGITMPILILGVSLAEDVPVLIENSITQAVVCEEMARAYSDAASACGGVLRVHVKVDTGMSRLGFLCNEEGLEASAAAIAVGISVSNTRILLP